MSELHCCPFCSTENWTEGKDFIVIPKVEGKRLCENQVVIYNNRVVRVRSFCTSGEVLIENRLRYVSRVSPEELSLWREQIRYRPD